MLEITGISNRHSGLVEDTKALGIMYVEGTLAKLLVTSGNGVLYCFIRNRLSYFIMQTRSDTEFEGAYCLIKTQTL